MGKYRIRKAMACILILSLFAVEGLPGTGMETVSAAEMDAMETPVPEQTEEPAVTSAPSDTPEPVSTPTPTPPAATSQPIQTVPPAQTAVPTQTATPKPERFVLMNKEAKYAKGGQTGIHYHKVKGKKIYHIQSYTTDSVQLTMSHPATFSIYGGGSKKEVKKKMATVSSKGMVKCHRKGKGEKLYTVVKAVSKTTGEIQYIYIYFQKKLTVSNGKGIHIYEKHTDQLKFDYDYKKVSISVTNKKKIKVSRQGRIEALKHGTAYITVKVKGSQKNEVRIKVIVQKEPWIVSSKDKLYDYEDMTKDLHALIKKYPGKTGLESIGKSYDSREIWCLRIGSSGASRKLVIDAAIHAREWLNTQVIMRQAEEILRDYQEYRKRFANTCIYIIPMDNPDGVSISQYGFDAIRNKKLRMKCEKIGHSDIWKANARGVNLNNNFPAGFIKMKKKKPHYMNYFGKKAGSEKETKALMKFINEVKPEAVLNLHSMGNVLYWDFNVEGKLYEQLNEFAAKVASFNKYALMPKSSSTDAAGGFADWLVYKKEIISITVETGSVRCPLPHSQFKLIYKRNNKMFQWFMTEY